MTVNKGKKHFKFRGFASHGWGAKKKHRGGGSRGGRGNAGSGKRADSRKPAIWDNPDYFGKHGFHSILREDITGINIRDLQERMKGLVKEGSAKEKGGVYAIDLESIGYNKLLGTGNATLKLDVTVKYASANAIDKVQKAGGKVNLTAVKKEKTEKPQPKEAEKKEAPAKKPEKTEKQTPAEQKAKFKSPAELIKEVKGR